MKVSIAGLAAWTVASTLTVLRKTWRTSNGWPQSACHQRAVAELASKVEILPARFGTVFLSDRSLADHIAKSKKVFEAVLKKITGSEEWGVKVFRQARTTPAASNLKAASGTDYLKKKAQSVVPRGKQEDPELLAFTEALEGASVEMSAGGKASSGQPNLVWHASFLVRRKEHKKFDAVLRKFTASLSDGYRVECSGPWPPYFCGAAWLRRALRSGRREWRRYLASR